MLPLKRFHVSLFRRKDVLGCFYSSSSDLKELLKIATKRKEKVLIPLSYVAKSARFVSSAAFEDCSQLANLFFLVGQNSFKLASFVPNCI